MSQATNKYLNDATKRLQDRFGNLPIVDAKGSLPLMPEPCDCKGADPMNPGDCVLVHTAKRQFHCLAAVFWATRAYLVMPDPKAEGRFRIVRYSVPAEMRRRTAAFDRGEPFPIGTPLELLAPSKHETLKHKRADDRKRRNTPRGRATQNLMNARKHLVQTQKHRENLRQHIERAHESAKPKMLMALDEACLRIRAAEKRVVAATKKCASYKQWNPGRPAPRPPIFDLTTRNGARGNYKFTPAVAA